VILWRRKARHHARCITSFAQRFEQPRGEFPSTDTMARKRASCQVRRAVIPCRNHCP
jgi:hypothetical protein